MFGAKSIQASSVTIVISAASAILTAGALMTSVQNNTKSIELIGADVAIIKQQIATLNANNIIMQSISTQLKATQQELSKLNVKLAYIEGSTKGGLK